MNRKSSSFWRKFLSVLKENELLLFSFPFVFLLISGVLSDIKKLINLKLITIYARQNRLNERLRGSSVMLSKKKEREERIRSQTEAFKEKLNDDKRKFPDNLKVIRQKVENNPLMMENIVFKKSMQEMR